MSTPAKYILEILSPGSGWCLDLGGGNGHMQELIEALGYKYVNLDLGDKADVIGDAHHLPFKESAFTLIISKDTLEHFRNPQQVIISVASVLSKGGLLALTFPLMHPFHKTDYYRWTPLGIRELLKGWRILYFDNTRWIFSILAMILGRPFGLIRLRFLVRLIRDLGYWLDSVLMPRSPASFAVGYRILARKL